MCIFISGLKGLTAVSGVKRHLTTQVVPTKKRIEKVLCELFAIFPSETKFDSEKTS